MSETPILASFNSDDHAHLYHLLVRELTDFAVFLTDPSGCITSWNPGVERILGYSESEWLGEPWDIVFTPEDRAQNQPQKEMTRAEQDGRAPDIRWHRKKDGTRLYVEGTLVALRRPDGSLLGFSKVMHDTTERKLGELQLAEKARLAALGADIGAALAQTTSYSETLHRCADAIVRHLDAAFARIWTLSGAGDVLELQASAGIYRHLDGQHARIPVGSFKIGQIAEEQKPYLTNDVAHDPRIGDPNWAREKGMVAFAGYPLLAQGRLVGVLGLFARHALPQDTLVSLESVAASIAIGIERRAAQTALRESEARFHTTFAAAPIGMVLTNTDGRFIETNQAYRDITGYTVDELAESIFLDLTHPDEAAENRQLFAQLLAGDIPSYTIEKRYRCKDGGFTWVRASATILEGGQKGQREIIGLVEDISDRRRGERERERLVEELARSNDELSQFAHVAAHDLQSPLRMVTIYTQLLEDSLQELPGDAHAALLKTVLEGANRMDQLIQALLRYAQIGQTRLDSAEVSMNSVVSDSIANLQYLIEESQATVEAEPLPTVRGDGIQLSQLMQNLLSNALKYRHAERQPKIRITASKVRQAWLFVVEDNGVGVDARYQAQIFAPLKRLHGAEISGTGMGLAVCKKIVERHGGRLWIESTVGSGSRFSFTLRS